MVDCTGLENRQPARVREFESHRFRQTETPSDEFTWGFLISAVNDQITPIFYRFVLDFMDRFVVGHVSGFHQPGEIR